MKKAQGLSVTTVIILALAGLVLVVAISIFYIGPRGFSSAISCQARQGKCLYNSVSDVSNPDIACGKESFEDYPIKINTNDCNTYKDGKPVPNGPCCTS